jgi:hypothetical protein
MFLTIETVNPFVLLNNYHVKEERTARAQHQRELELKQKIRQRQQLEIQRQKIVLDRRCAELEKLNTKKMV